MGATTVGNIVGLAAPWVGNIVGERCVGNGVTFTVGFNVGTADGVIVGALSVGNIVGLGIVGEGVGTPSFVGLCVGLAWVGAVVGLGLGG